MKVPFFALPLLTWRTLRYGVLRGNWLPSYLLRHHSFDRSRISKDTPIDVMVLVTDHFEPARKHGLEAAVQSVAAWCETFASLAESHRDSDGRPPQHTWFY